MKSLTILAALTFVSAAFAQSSPQVEIELPNKHEFMRLDNVLIKEKEGRTAINGSVFKTSKKHLPWGSHLHIDLLGHAEGEEVIIERVLYRFRRSDFDDSGRFQRFFKYIDLSNPKIDKIVVEPFTQKHDDKCGVKEKASEG